MAHPIDPDIFAVRVEALTYKDKMLDKNGNLDFKSLSDKTECSWQFLDVMHGHKEEIKAKLEEINYLCRVVNRPGYVRRQIWNDFTDKKNKSVSIDQPLNFVELWRNF